MEKTTLKKTCILLLLCLFAASPVSAEHLTADVVVIGGGCGGCAAAIQAARLGAKVVVLEETEILGGQMTASAVCTLDDRGFTRTGIYREFLDEVFEFYRGVEKNINCCYWGGNTIALEPLRGAEILRQMLENNGVKIIYNIKPVSVKNVDGKIKSVEFKGKGKDDLLTVKAKIFIDATECGDFLPMTSARYRVGNSLSPDPSLEGILQDITWVAVVKKYLDGVPPELRVKTIPPNYYKYLPEFRAIVVKNGNNWPNGYPYNPVTHNEYRAIPDLSSDLVVDGSEPYTWKNVTKTCINWANDYPGGTYGAKGQHLSARYLTDMEYRKNIDLSAMEKTLAFIYYMQHELGMEDWSISDEGYKSQLTDWTAEEKFKPYTEILKHFPCRPYIRESKRLVGMQTLTVMDVRRDTKLKRSLTNRIDSVALGEYPIDLHGVTETKYLEADLRETQDSVPNDWQYVKGGIFQIPAGVLIPEKVDGLMAAEKNISVSRVVNGSTRVHPATMLTGQAAGAIAGLAVKHNIQPRDVNITKIQKELLKAKDRISVYRFRDVDETNPDWPYCEFAVVREFLKPDRERKFGTDTQLCFIEIQDIFRKLSETDKTTERDPFVHMTCLDVAQWIEEWAQDDIQEWQRVLEYLKACGKEPFTKLTAAKIIWDKVR